MEISARQILPRHTDDVLHQRRSTAPRVPLAAAARTDIGVRFDVHFGPIGGRVDHRYRAALPRYRGQGIGKRLMLQALAAAQAFPLQRVELTVRENNKNAIALYRNVGFEIEGVQRNAVLVDGTYENVILMAVLF